MAVTWDSKGNKRASAGYKGDSISKKKPATTKHTHTHRHTWIMSKEHRNVSRTPGNEISSKFSPYFSKTW